MTATAILATGTAGIFLLLLVVTWYLVPLLQQARRTASAMEELLTTTRPKLDDALDQLRSVLARADGVMAAVEHVPGTREDLVGVLSKVAGSWQATARAVSTITAFYTGFSSLWKIFTRSRAPEGAKPSTEEGGS